MNTKGNLDFDLVAMGRACVDESCLIESGTHTNLKIPIMKRNVCGGGQAATSAVVVSQLGGKSAYVGNLGRDKYGDLIFNELNEFGVDTNWITRPENFCTPKALILVDSENGERTIYYEKTSPRSRYPIPRELLFNTRALILDPEVSVEELSEILDKKNPESFIVYDGERSRPALNEMMKHADFFIASETLLDMNGPEKRSQTFRTMRKAIQGELIFTFGEAGCVWVQKDEFTHLNAYPSVNVVDTTGAGDVFHACFAYFFSKNQDILQTLRLSSFCAGRSTERLGNRDHKDLTIGAEQGLHSIHSKKLSEDEFENLIQTRAPQA